MHPAVILGGTFLFWIAARKRLSDYAALMQRNSSGISPAATGGGTNGNTPIAISAADSLEEIMDNIWRGLKT